MAKFRHITDERAGAYPHLANQDVYKWRADFNYEQWQEQATLELCNVPFNSDYEDIVDWQTAENRDAQLAARVFYTSEPLKTHFRIDKNGQVKVPPIPADSLDRANYLIVRNPVAPVPHEKQDGVRDLFYFILDAEQESPNATRLTVTLDWWTTYFDKLNIESGYVERGHIAMHESATPEAFLADPINNTAHLLAPDVNINAQGEIVAWQRTEALEGERAVVFSLYNDINQLNLARPADVVSNTIGAPSYSGDFSENVSGFEWNLGAQSASGQARTARTATLLPPHGLGDNSKNNLGGWLYAVPSHNASRFFDNLAAYFPHILQNISDVFILPSSLLEVRERAVVADVEIALVRPKPVKTDIKLTPNDFAYPPAYAHLTKLYTTPYARLRLTDLNGNIQDIEVQNTTSQTSLNIIASLVAGGTIRAEIDGTNSRAGDSYSWKLVALNQEEQKTLYGGAGAYMLERAIPTYALQLGAQKIYDLAKAHNQQLARAQAVTAYETGQAQLVTSFNNDIRSIETDYTNTTRSANTSRANDLANAALASTQTALMNQLAGENLDTETLLKIRIRDLNNTQVRYTYDANQNQRDIQLALDIEHQTTTTQNDQMFGIVGGLVSGGMALATGNVAGAASAMGGALMGAVQAEANSQLTISSMTAQQDLETGMEAGKLIGYSGQRVIYNGVEVGRIGGSWGGTGGTALYNQQSNLYRMHNWQVENAASKTAASTRTATNSTDASNTTSLANSQRNLDTTLANSLDSRNTARTNLDNNRVTSTSAAQRNLNMAGLAEATGYTSAGLAPHSTYGTASGNHTALEAEREGYAVQVVTQTDDEIARIGDYFLMYGYAANRVYDMTRLAVMPHFTYWQASRVFFQPVANAYVNEQAKNLFSAGVTVWNRLEEVNKNFLYENKE